MKEEAETQVDIYESVKQYFSADETRYNRICSYLSDRLTIEYSYSKEMEKLSKKYMNSDAGFEKTIDKVITKFAEYDSIVCSEHDKFRSYLNLSLEELTILKKNQDIVLKQLKDNIKPVARYHLDLASTGIPKSKANYIKKVEQEKENTDTKNSSKIYKLGKDVAAAEHAYRVGITHLEEARLQLYSTRDSTRQQYEILEKERNTLLQKVIKQYSRIQQRMLSRFDEEYKPVYEISQSINPSEDTNIAVKSFMQTWKIADKVYFEHYKNKLPAKDMVFGIPLSIASRGSPDYLPRILPKCFEAIEKRAARVSDVTDLKIACETSLDDVNLLDDSVDINAVAGLVKMYLRELPDPLLIFPAKERIEYSVNTSVNPPTAIPIEERLPKLKFKIKTMTKEKEAVLRALLQHLNIIIANSAVNKMPVGNIAMIFSAVIFHSQQDIPQEKENKSWFGKHNNDHQDISYGMIKADSVIEDLLTNYDEFFSIPLDKKAYSNPDISSKKNSMRIVYDLPPELPKRIYPSNDDLSKFAKEELAISTEESIGGNLRKQSKDDVGTFRKHSRDDLTSKGNLYDDDEMDVPDVPDEGEETVPSPIEKDDEIPYSPSNLQLPSPAKILAPVDVSSPLTIPDLSTNYVATKSGSIHSTLPQIPRVSSYKLKSDLGDSNPLLTDIMQSIAPEESEKNAVSAQQSVDCLAFTASEYPDFEKLHLVSVDSTDELNDPNIIRLE
ncbi:hypothetical protein HDV06_005958 [Boothiomyces sp. JEL0866]|nr:hypothetical protein HDV06_005958 [Boothiomyces sp. JEL0866]